MKIKMRLNSSDINRCIRELREYSNLDKKCAEFTKELMEIGCEVVKNTIMQSEGEIEEDVIVGMTSKGEITKMYLKVSSNRILFLEFGAGITYNKSRTHPLAQELGYGVGSYPNQTHAFDPEGWYYIDENGQWHHSYGTKASMPVFNASLEMRNKISNIAKKYFC